jgi:hypothetical protein
MFDYKKIAANNFSWSIFRSDLFHFCEKAYFYHYYGANGGAEESSDADSRQLHLLKKIINGDFWVRSLFTDALVQQLLNSSGHKPGASFARELLHRIMSEFNRQKHDCELQQWQFDHNKLNLLEIYYGIKQPESYFAGLRQNAHNAAQLFLNGGLSEILIKINALQWKRITIPILFDYDGQSIWLAPDLIWDKNDNIVLLHIIANSSNSVKLQHFAALDTMFAANYFRRPPESIVSIFYNLHTGNSDTVVPSQSDINEICSKIRTDNIAMHSKISDTNQVQGVNFLSVNSSQCNSCRFKEYCINS